MSQPTLSASQLMERIRQKMYRNEILAWRYNGIGAINIIPPKNPSGSGWDAELIDSGLPTVVQVAFECAKKQVQEEFDLQRPPLGGAARGLE